jgi:cellulose synthase/poly-beta-1,6-N-acetylglucosamine synthase-like glycosyltransferase/peptidoglycan/xylan/chitin deacetylase (PgdA/CDA1 family)/spore germination protein YaaH
MPVSRFVFFDFEGKRWKRVRLASLLGAVFIFIIIVVFVRSLLILPKLRKPDALPQPQTKFSATAQLQESIHPSRSPPAWLRQKPVTPAKPIMPRQPALAEEPVVLAFYVPSDAASFQSLQSHYQKITHLAPEWFSMRSFEEPLVAAPDRQVVKFNSSANLQLLPMLSNLDGNEWQPEIVEELARHPEKRLPFFEKLRDELQAVDARGVLVHWEQVDPAYRSELTSLLTDLANYLHNEELELWLCIPVGNDIAVFDLDALAAVVNRFVALLFDENGEEDSPGPTASLPWWNEWFDVLLEHGAPDQWIVGIGNYGYDWPHGDKATILGFTDVMARAGVAGTQAVGAEAPLYQPHFSYEESGVSHSVWFLDAVTFRNQYAKARRRGVGGTALYRLGNEDESIWNVIADPKLAPSQLEQIKPDDVVANIGQGDLLVVSNEREQGLRTVTALSPEAWGVRYEKLPKYPLIYHSGGSATDQVVLSFDDGPDPLWTPLILDILKQEDIHAVFFVVGSRAVENPALIRRILAEGHEIGNHSYSHPDLSEATEAWTVFELNANQRILEGIAGISTLLFRPTYHADTYPQSFDEFMTLVRAQQLGYLSISESIDSEDWNAPTPEGIIEHVKERRHEGNIILLHDGGGDRSATVTALPRIIRYLRSRGDQIVSLQTLLKFPREVLMPPIPADDSTDSRVIAQAGFTLVESIEEFAWAFMIGVTVLLFIRTGMIVTLAVRHRLVEKKQPKEPNFKKPLSVLMAAYNESKVIASTIRSVLASDYEGELELIVVNDGSIDDTAEIVAGLAVEDPRIHLISQHNLGKALALNRALEAARNETIVMLDADTQFQPETMRLLVAPLAQPEVGAVCGHIRVGNLTSFIARFQALEYICGFNLDRRAYAHWNAITVAPGAISAFKRLAIERAGGIVADTLAEDTDLTLHLHRTRYRIRYVSKAIAYTEAPDNIRALVRQRIRWAFGTLQCLWKHRGLLCSLERPGLGFFSLPSVWFCHVFLVALVPVVDMMLLLSVSLGTGLSVVEYAILFFALEWALALCGCYFEGESLRTSLWIFPMRIVYRPLLCLSVWLAIIRALRGAWYGWGKLDRKGTVKIGVEMPQEAEKRAA